MGKSAPDSPDPAALIKAQTDANRVNQYTPYGNLQYGKFDENGNFIANTERESSVQTQRPQDQQFQNYSDAGRNALFQSIFGNYNAPAGGSVATTATGAPANSSATGAVSNPASTMSKPATNVEDKHFYSDGTPKKEWTYDQLYGPGGLPKVQGAAQIWSDQQARAANKPAETTATAAPPKPYSDTQGGGIGSFSGFNLNSAGDPKAIAAGLSNWGNANSLKSGLTDFYNLNSIKGGLPSVSTDFSNDRMRAEEAVYNRAKSRFEPDFAERRRQLEQRLADTGNVMGSEGYNTEMDRLGRSENDAYQNAAWDAVNAGSNEYQRLADLGLRTRGQMFGEDTSLAGLTSGQRAQQFGENQGVFDAQNRLRQLQLAEGLGLFNADNTARSNQLNEMTSLLGMQSPKAQLNTSMPEVPAANIMLQDYKNRLDAYNNSMNGFGDILGIAGTLGGAYLTGGSSLGASAGLGIGKTLVPDFSWR